MTFYTTLSVMVLPSLLLSPFSIAYAEALQIIDNSETTQVLPYEVESDHKASNCELYVNGFGDGTETSYHAIGGSLYEAWIRVNGVDQVERNHFEVVNVGGYYRFFEQSTEAPQPVLKEMIVLASPQADEPYYFRADFRYKWHNMDREVSRTVQNFSFFVDVRRNDRKVYRLWLTDGSRDFTISSVFGQYPLTSWISVGPGLRSMRYIEGFSPSPIFNARRTCGVR